MRAPVGKLRWRLGSVFWAGLLAATAGHAAEPVQTLAIGQPAPDFALPGVDGKTHRLADFDQAKILVVVFTCNHCPTAQAYEDRLIALAKEFRDRDVAMVAISPNDPQAVALSELGYTDLGDTLKEMKIRAEQKKFPYPYLYDGETQEVSRAYGAQATPHVFVFDQQRKLRYVGRVDDGEVDEPKSHDARNAITALMAGKPVPVEKTRVFGCSTKWSDKRDQVEELTKRWDEEKVELEVVGPEAISELSANKTDKFRLINVWATWCAPCVEELPELVKMHRMYRHRPFELVLVSMDTPDAKDAALERLKSVHASSTNVLFGGDDYDVLAEALDPEWGGPVPHTILVAPGGKVVYRHSGPIDPLEVRAAIVEQIGRTYAADRKKD